MEQERADLDDRVKIKQEKQAFEAAAEAAAAEAPAYRMVNDPDEAAGPELPGSGEHEWLSVEDAIKHAQVAVELSL